MKGTAPMTEIPKAPTITFLENPHAPALFTDGAVEIDYIQGNFRITFETVHFNYATHPATGTRVVTSRLIIPPSAAERLRNMLTAKIEALKQEALQSTRKASTVQ
jgi:hypothetical protein